MKKYFPALWLFCLFTHVGLAQGIVFEPGPFDKVLKKAKKERKLVFLHINSPTCGQCTEVATQGFSSPTLTEKFSINFVSYRVGGGSDEGKALLRRYELANSLVALFLTADGSLLNRYDGSTSFAYTYLLEADKAIARRNQPPLSQLDEQYAKGDRSPAFLRDYIQRRQDLRLPTDEMLDTYVRSLPKDSLRTESTLRYLIGQVPILGTYADSVMRVDWYGWNRLFMSYPLPKRIEFNQTLNRKTQQKAIATKNEALALKNAQYTAGTYGNQRHERQWAYESAIMGYYQGVKDTSMYIRTARRFFDAYIMPLNPDSVTRAERKTIFDAARPAPGEKQFAVQVPPPRYGQSLNYAAWRFWQIATKPDDLEKALTWSKRSLEYADDPSWVDTYAHLLYKLGRREEAIEQEQTAITRLKSRQSPTASFERTLQKMKDGTLVPEPDFAP